MIASCLAVSPCQQVAADGHVALVGHAADVPFLLRCDLRADVFGTPVIGRERRVSLVVFCHKCCFIKVWQCELASGATGELPVSRESAKVIPTEGRLDLGIFRN